MKISILVSALYFCLSLITVVQADQKTVDQLLSSYTKQGAAEANAQSGKVLWSKGFKKNKDGSLRHCSACHTDDLTNMGEHFRTGKAIKPMSPSVNSKRLTSQKKVKKWLRRNCKWTIGRECTPQEKANIIAFINTSTQLKF